MIVENSQHSSATSAPSVSSAFNAVSGRQRPLALFFLLTYVTTWACFLGASKVTGTPYWILLVLGAFMPSTIAMILKAREDGKAGVKALLLALGRSRLAPKWYVFALGYMLAVKLVVLLLHRGIAGAWPAYTGDGFFTTLAAFVPAAILGGPLGEELGWRGYALPRLSQRFGLARASVLLGVIWACWHLPVFFIAGLDQFGQSFPVYVLRVTGISVAMAWLWANTDHSLLLAVMMHAAINQTKDIASSVVQGATNPWSFSASLDGWLTVAVVWAAAFYCLYRMSRRPEEKS